VQVAQNLSALQAEWIMAIAAIVGLFVGMLSIFMTVGQLKCQVSTLWEFHVRRGTVEAVKIGWGTVNSPFHISATGFEAALPFLTKFLPFYAGLIKKNPKMPERELMLRFEAEFGDFIMEQICIPKGVSQGACLIAILAACEVGITETADAIKKELVTPVTKEKANGTP